MPTYFCRYFWRTYASVSKHRAAQQKEQLRGWLFNLDRGRVAIRICDYVMPIEGSDLKMHAGLILDCDVKAENIDEARERGKALSEVLLNRISYLTLADTGAAIFEFAYQRGDNLEQKEFVAVIGEEHLPVLGSIRPLDENHFGPLFVGFDKQMTAKIGVALSWLRKSLGEENPYDEFIAIWVVLEALNSELARFVTPEHRFPECRKCHHQMKECPQCHENLGLVSEVGNVRAFAVQEMNMERKLFNELYSRRSKILHGRGSFDPGFTELIRQEVPTLRHIAINATGKLLGLPAATVSYIEAQSIRRSTYSMRHVISGTLTLPGPPPRLTEWNKQPQIKLKDVNVSYSLAGGGKISLTPSTTFSFHNGTFQLKRAELWGDKYAGMDATVTRNQ